MMSYATMVKDSYVKALVKRAEKVGCMVLQTATPEELYGGLWLTDGYGMWLVGEQFHGALEFIQSQMAENGDRTNVNRPGTLDKVLEKFSDCEWVNVRAEPLEYSPGDGVTYVLFTSEDGQLFALDKVLYGLARTGGQWQASPAHNALQLVDGLSDNPRRLALIMGFAPLNEWKTAKESAARIASDRVTLAEVVAKIEGAAIGEVVQFAAEAAIEAVAP